MAKHTVICVYCGQKFDANIEPYVKVKNRYAHKKCADDRIPKEEKDKARLEEYLKQLYGEELLDQKLILQAEKYHNDYGYTYSGMIGTLKFFYEIKKNPIDKDRNTLGIIPWVYRDAQLYYSELKTALLLNKDKNINDYIPKEKDFQIKAPKRRAKTKSRFNFLDKEGEE